MPYGTEDLLTSSLSIGQLIPESSRYLRFHSRDFIDQARSKKKPWHMHHKYDASLKSLLAFATNLHRYDPLVDIGVDKPSLRGLVDLLGYAANFTEASHLLISTRLLPEKYMTSFRVRSQKNLQKGRRNAEGVSWCVAR